MWRMAIMAALAVGLACTAHAAEAATHSGELVAVSPGGRGVTIKELGPWDGHHQTVRTLSVRLTPATTIETVARMTQIEPGARRGGFREDPVSVAALQPGEYVTIKARLDAHQQLVADTVEIVRPDGTADSRR
jgi:hypothetical protein